MIPSDDLSEDPSYFDRRFDADKVEARERLKAKREIQGEAKAKAPPLNRRKLLLRIASDSAERYSVRMDARRLLEIADLRPGDFQRQFTDFIAWRDETTKQ